MKEKSETAGLNLKKKKKKTMASGSITSLQIDGEKWKQWQNLFSLSSKSLQTVIAVMKLKDAHYWKKSCDKARQHI